MYYGDRVHDSSWTSFSSICNVLDRYFIELEIPGSMIYYYYMAESVSAMQLVNLRSILVIRTKISKKMLVSEL